MTGPAAVFRSAPTGHTDAHAGSPQFMHKRRMNLSPLVSTTVNLCSDWTSSAATASEYGSLFWAAQAPSHCLHPMQTVASYSSALLIEISPARARSAPLLQRDRGRRTSVSTAGEETVPALPGRPFC